MKNKVTIVGGGLAGLTAAIHLSKMGIEVTVFEKNQYPKHKVCGEYISNEVLPYINWLDIGIENLKPTHIAKLEFSLVNGKTQNAMLPLGGFGVSRYALDYHLYEIAIQNGCHFIHENITTIDFKDNIFTIQTSNNNTYFSEIVIGAFGKRSNIDQSLKRNFMFQKAPWLAVKCHYSGIFPNDLVGLHNFDGGYCGVSKVENDIINICYITNYKSFQRYKDIATFEKEVVQENPTLKAVLDQATSLFDKPLSISQISFESKKAVENHILMIGDTAGLIHPLCGNGMAMAIHSAKLASDSIVDYFNDPKKNRTNLEQNYTKKWNDNFRKRILAGRWISKLLQQPKLSKYIMKIMLLFPFLLTFIIKNTHGKVINVVNQTKFSISK